VDGEQPLAGVRVLELGDSVAVASCGQQFARWGAEVLLVEGEGGAALRSAPPRWSRGGRSGSVLFEFLAVGKRSVAAWGPASCSGADVILVGEGAGAGPMELRRANRAAVVVSITAFGLSGPCAGEAATTARLEALSGYLGLNGPADGAPLLSPAHLLDHAAGVSAFVGALAALIRRARTGAGDLVEVSVFETIAGLLPYLREQHQGHPSPRLGGTPEGARLLRCRDGFVSVAPAIPAHIGAYREVFGASGELLPDAPLAGGRGLAADRVAAALAPLAQRKDVREVFEGLQARGVVCGVVKSPGEVLRDPQLAARGFFQELPHPVLGPLPIAGRAAGLTGVSDRAPCPAPAGPEAEPPAWDPRGPAGESRDPPLAGFRVLDLTQAWIGPLAGMILGDLGAEVVKVETARRPDVWRWLGQAVARPDLPATEPLNRSWYFNAVNRNKLGLGLDLARPQGAEIFLKLAADADVVLENFTPRVMTKFGLGYDALRNVRPEIVLTSFSGFGADGPLAEFKANGASIEALAGWDALHRDETGKPVLMGAYPADPICGLQMAACTLVALYRRVLTGQGGHVEGSMLGAAAGYVGDALLAEAMAEAGASVESPAPCGELRRARPGEWTLVDAEGAETPVRSTMEALEDPQLAVRGWFLDLEAPGLGISRHNGRFWRFDAARLPDPQPPPKVGEHTRMLLSRLADAAEVQRLFDEGVAGALP
jgi:crotonobetainyl-CoA:carnitine CoA-transferase CaiB-like acyl-CoA transferase